MVLRAARIEWLHKMLLQVFDEHLQRSADDRRLRPLSIESDADPNADPAGWKKAVDKAPVSFSLTNRGEREMTERKVGGRQPVYILPGFSEYEPGAWVGWHEEWKNGERATRGQFDLVGVSLSFFWGYGRSRSKKGVLRAEWDRVAHRGGEAAQPHWHIDSTLMVDFAVRNVVRMSQTRSDTIESLQEIGGAQGSSLEEIGDQRAIQDLDASGIHLGMGGWLQANTAPARWQCPVKEPDELICWVGTTLEYAIKELARLSGGGLCE